MSTGKTSQFDVNHWVLRLIAFIIDSIIVGAIAAIIFFLAVATTVFSGFYLIGYYLFFPFLIGILEVIYFVIMEVYYGATVGKMALGLKVQTETGGKLTFQEALIRNISKVFWVFLLIDWVLGVAIPGKDQSQKYTDRIAGTTVVSVRRTLLTTTPEAPTTPPPPPP